MGYINKIEIRTTRAKHKQMENEIDLLQEKGILATLVYKKLCKYILGEKIKNEISHRKQSNKEVINLNIIEFSKDTVLSYGFELINRIKTNRERSRKANQVIKDLIDAGVIYPFSDNTIMLNPLYYYEGIEFLQCYQEWCNLTGEKPKYLYIEGSGRRKNPLNDKWEVY